MTDEALDTLMKHALLDALRIDWESEDRIDAVFYPSRRCQRHVQDMLADPKKWCKQRLRPAWKIVMHRVAAIIFAMLAGIIVLQAVNTQSRTVLLGHSDAMQSAYFTSHVEKNSSMSDVALFLIETGEAASDFNASAARNGHGPNNY